MKRLLLLGEYSVETVVEIPSDRTFQNEPTIVCVAPPLMINNGGQGLLVEARAELNETRRREMYVEMQRIVSDDGGR